MASKNQLVGSGKVYTEEEVKEEVKVFKKAPMWLYSKECVEGRVIKTDEEIDKLLAAGWKDHPGKVVKLPGFEKLYEGEELVKITPVVEPVEVEEDIDISTLFKSK
jgi:hypothetical protein